MAYHDFMVGQTTAPNSAEQASRRGAAQFGGIARRLLPAQLMLAGALLVVLGLVWIGALVPQQDQLLLIGAIGILVLTAATVFATRRAAAQNRRQAEQALLLAQALDTARSHDLLLSEILDAVAFGVVRLTATGEVALMNRTQERFERLRGDSDDLFADDGVTPVSAAEGPRGLAARGERFVDRVFWYGRPERERVALAVSAMQLAATGPEQGDVLLVYRDVTAQINAIRARDDLVSSVSHELRTPLTSVLGNIELALDEDVSASARHRLEVAERNGQRLLELISQILEASRGSERPLRREPTNLSALVAEAVESQAVVAADHGITVAAALADPVWVSCDASRIRQVIDNLLSNAIKYNRTFGLVSIEIDQLPHEVALRVTDTGYGISPDELPLVFEQHFRSERVRNSGVHGHGLGLSISRQIARQHGGELELVSVLGEGSTGMLVLPLTPANGA